MFNPSEAEISFDSFIKFPLFWFKMVFFDFKPLGVNPRISDSLKFTAKTSFCLLCIVAFILSIISLIMYSFLIAEDFLTASVNVPNAVTSTLVTLKTIVVLLRRRDIWNIFEDLRVHFRTHGGDNAKYSIKKYLDSYHSVVKTNAMFFFVIILSVVSPTLAYFTNGTMELSVKYWFPFDPFKPKNFPIALLWINLLTFLFPVVWLSLDSLLYALITVVAMEFDILRADFLDIEQAPRSERIAKLKSLVMRHNELFEIRNKLQSIYEIVFVVCFVISSLVMCYVAFILSNANEFALYTYYVPFLFLVGGQILLLCFFGQKLLDSNKNLAEGIFNSGWEDLGDVVLTKHLMLVIARAQATKRLTAMGFCDLTLNNFTSVGFQFL